MSDLKKGADLALTDNTNTVKLIDFARGENSSSELCQMPDNFPEVWRETCLKDNTDITFLVGACSDLVVFLTVLLFKLSGIK